MEVDLSVDATRFKYFATINIPFENSNDASKFMFFYFRTFTMSCHMTHYHSR